MADFSEIIINSPYSLEKKDKKQLLTARLKSLTEKHKDCCKEYREIVTTLSGDIDKAETYYDLPFIPVRLFKELSLKSVPEEELAKTMTSSGTSGQATSKIFLDKNTAANQQKTMVKIVSDFTGSSRMPMIIVDCPSVIKDRAQFSARGAGILGFSMFGSKRIYALDDDMKLDVERVSGFLEDHKGERIFLFGFTFMIWQYFYRELVRLKEEGITFDLSNAVMIHGGGWKKLQSEAVSPEEFHDRLKEVCGLDRIHDYYGMVEQTGCIYMQCEYGHLHASIFSDVIVRRAKDFSVCDVGEPGIIQVVSTIPESYPGHSLLTEDEGVILGEDDCPCGRKGKYFRILGRIQNAELRGCSDTFAAGRILKDAASSGKMNYLVGDETILAHIEDTRPLEPFDERVIDFCENLSRELMSRSDARLYPDVTTLGFWLRRSSISKLRERFIKNEDKNIRLGRGVVFHIAPSNVPVNFAYSLISGLLTGNANIVRVPSKDFPQVKAICDGITKVLGDYEDLKPYLVLARYDRDKEINDRLSAMCDVRVIWGGDNTISELRKSELRPRSTEITFADRYSLAVIDAGSYLEASDKQRVARDFYNDTYLSDQNACTSPRCVVWHGKAEDIIKAKDEFWHKLHELVLSKYDITAIQSIDKLTECCMSAVDCADCDPRVIRSDDNLITRIRVSKLDERLMDHRGHSGLFYECDISDIMEMRDICDNTHCQTIGIIGDPSYLQPLIMSGIRGVDRVVPVGHTMDFDLIWDGYDLVDRLTRTVVI